MKQLTLFFMLMPFFLMAQTWTPSEISIQPKKKRLMVMVTDTVLGLPDTQYYWTGVPFEDVIKRIYPLFDSDSTDNVVYTAGSGISILDGVISSTGGGSGSSLWTDSGTNTYLTELADNVGIGVSNPTKKLEVSEDVRLSGINFGKGANSNTSNTMIGANSGINQTSAILNASLGTNTARNLTSGFSNVLIGYAAGQSLTTQRDNLFVGSTAGINSTSSFSVHLGARSGEKSMGNNNTFIGSLTGLVNTTGRDNIFLGSRAAQNNTTGNFNTAIGSNSMVSNTTGSFNTSIGYNSMSSNVSGSGNTGVGYLTNSSLTTGSSNVSIGNQANNRNISGSENTAVGTGAGEQNQTGNFNTYIGRYAGRFNTGSNNTIIGRWAGFTSIGSGNVFIGHQAGYGEMGNNKLYIDNSTTSSPLVYGDFTTNFIKINGSLQASTNLKDSDGDNGINGQFLSSTGTGTNWVNPANSGENNVQSDWNESDSNSDAYILNKPTTITSAQANEITANTAKNTYPSADATKLAGIAAGAEVNVQSDWNATSGDALILNKPTINNTTNTSVSVSGTTTKTIKIFDSDGNEVSTNFDDENDIPNNTTINLIAGEGLNGGGNFNLNQGISPTITFNVDNEFSTVEKTKLAGIAAGAEVNVQSDWNATSGDALILNKPTTITTAQANEIAANTAKNTYPSADATKLAGIAAGAEVNVQSDWNATSGDGLILNKPTINNTTNTSVSVSGTTTKTIKIFDSDGNEVSTNFDDENDIPNNTTINLIAGEGLNGGGNFNLNQGISPTITFNVDNEFTTAEDTKLAGIATGAEVNVQADWNETDTNNDAYIKNKPTISGGLTLTGDGLDLEASNTELYLNFAELTTDATPLSTSYFVYADGTAEKKLTFANLNSSIAPIWGNITNIPSGFSDGVDNTGGITTTGNGLDLEGGNTELYLNFAELTTDATPLSTSYFVYADGTAEKKLTFANLNSTIAPIWGNITNIPSGFSDGVDNDSNNYINGSTLSNTTLNLTGVGSSGTSIDLINITDFSSVEFITGASQASNTFTSSSPTHIQTAADNILLNDNRAGRFFVIQVYSGNAQINTTSGTVIVDGVAYTSGAYNHPSGTTHTYIRNSANTHWIVLKH